MKFRYSQTFVNPIDCSTFKDRIFALINILRTVIIIILYFQYIIRVTFDPSTKYSKDVVSRLFNVENCSKGSLNDVQALLYIIQQSISRRVDRAETAAAADSIQETDGRIDESLTMRRDTIQVSKGINSLVVATYTRNITKIKHKIIDKYIITDYN